MAKAPLQILKRYQGFRAGAILDTKAIPDAPCWKVSVGKDGEFEDFLNEDEAKRFVRDTEGAGQVTKTTTYEVLKARGVIGPL